MFKIRPTFFIRFSVIPMSGCQTASTPNPAQVQTVSIKEARDMTTGEVVCVSGIVTVQSGAFASSISSGFVIQDDTAGIYVLDTNHVFKMGEKVQVTGKRCEEFNQLNISLESVKKFADSRMVTPRSVKTGSMGEAKEGYLIQAAGRITRVVDDAPYGYKVFIDDGSGEYQIFINASTDLIEDTAVWEVGDFIDVIGFAGQYEDTYEIMPRILSDIKKSSGKLVKKVGTLKPHVKQTELISICFLTDFLG